MALFQKKTKWIWLDIISPPSTFYCSRSEFGLQEAELRSGWTHLTVLIMKDSFELGFWIVFEYRVISRVLVTCVLLIYQTHFSQKLNGNTKLHNPTSIYKITYLDIFTRNSPIRSNRIIRSLKKLRDSSEFKLYLFIHNRMCKNLGTLNSRDGG